MPTRRIHSTKTPSGSSTGETAALEHYKTTDHVFVAGPSGTARLIPNNIAICKGIIATAVDDNIFMADEAFTVVAVRAVNRVAGPSSATVTVVKCTTTQAPSAGALVATAHKLDTTADTVTTLALATTASSLKLAVGDRLALTYNTTTLTSLIATMEVVLTPTPPAV
jgi:hypothetical protein